VTGSSKPTQVEFGGPATYRIVVQGIVQPEWHDLLAGMKVTTLETGSEAVRSTLVGHLRDQTELSGVLDALYGLHLPILRVEIAEEC
jgi:hypothetical protein